MRKRIFKRLSGLLCEKQFSNLCNSHVLIVGVGGVGGYVAEFLARSGVGALSIIDHDVVEESNINRQVVALNSTIGKPKVEVMKNRILDINPDCRVFSVAQRFSEENADQILSIDYDFVVDCIDDVPNKCLLIERCLNKRMKIISSMGAGRRFNLMNFVVCDIFDTKYDKLAKKMRSELKKIGITKHMVVCSNQPNDDNSGGDIASVCYNPCACACVLSHYVINNLAGESEGER